MRSGICIYSSTKSRSSPHTFFSRVRCGLINPFQFLFFFRAHEDLNREKRRSVNRVKKGYG